MRYFTVTFELKGKTKKDNIFCSDAATARAYVKNENPKAYIISVE